jgi:hypothetical protein
MTTFYKELISLHMEEAKRRAQKKVDELYQPDQLDIRKRKLEEFTRIFFRELAGY